MKRQENSNSKQIILAVVGVIFDDHGRVLLSKRHQPESKSWHGKWQFPGGEVEYGEHPLDALHRELKEEIYF